MKTYQYYLLPSLALAAFVPLARAEKEVIIRRLDADAPHHGMAIHRDDDNVEKEKVAFLGVETAPVGRALSTQLGLARDTGLVVTQIMEKSPAADVLKEDDVLTKLDDQILVNMPQLSVLVRARKEGDEVKLTVIRGGKELTVKTRLGVHEVPKLADAFFFHNGGPGLLPPGAMPGPLWEHRLPGMGADDARDVLHMIERERGNFMTGPGMHILGRRGSGSTIVDLARSNISYSDDDGSIEIKEDNGKRNLTVKNAQGEVAFQGPINTAEERAKLPPPIVKRLGKLETDTMSFEVGDDFRPEVVPLPAEPGKTKISHPQEPAGDRRLRSL